MILVCIIDAFVVAGLVGITLFLDLESALPFLSFCLVLLPDESKLVIPGLTDLTSSRVAIITFAVLFMIFRKKRKENEAQHSLPLKYLMVLTALWYLVATVNSIVFAVSLKTVLSQVFDYYLIYILYCRTVTRADTTRKILLAVVSAVSVCCVLGLFEIYAGWSVIDLFPASTGRLATDAGVLMDLERGVRARATFPHPIHFGVALALAIPLTLYLLGVTKSAFQRTILWFAMGLMFWGTYKTSSRGPWLGLLLSLFLLSVLSQASTRRRVLVLFALAAAALIVRPGVWETLQSDYLSTLDPNSPEGESYANRTDLIRIGTAVMAKSFSREVWGYGPESFYFLHLYTKTEDGRIVPSLSCDDSWLEMAIESGYVGLLLTALLLFKPLRLTFGNYLKSSGPDRQIYAVLFINMLAFYFMMLSVAIYAWGQQAYILWMLIALALAYPHTVPSENMADQSGETVVAEKVLTTRFPVPHRPQWARPVPAGAQPDEIHSWGRKPPVRTAFQEIAWADF
jgi:O-antigen ligase